MAQGVDPLRLPLRLTTEADESIVGFLVRLTHRNCFDSPRWVMEIADLAFRRIDAVATKPFDLALLSRVSGVEEAILRRMTYWPTGQRGQVRFFGHSTGRDMVPLRHRRACPRCLDESPYHRAAWDLSVVSVCPHHAVGLVRECWRCGRKLDWRLPTLTACECGADLRKCPAEPIPREELQGIWHIHRVLGLSAADPAPGSAGAVGSLSAHDALTLLLNLGWFATGARQLPHPIKLCSEGVATHQLLNTGFLACLDWPEAFFQYLDSWRATQGASRRREGIATEIQPVADRLVHPGLSGPLRQLVAPALHRYLRPSPAPGFRSKEPPPPRLGTDVISLEAAALTLDRPTERVRRVLEAHSLIAPQEDLNPTHVPVVATDVVEDLRQQMEDLIGNVDLRALLGIARKMTAALIDARLLRAAEGPAAELFGAGAWRRADIERLLSGLETHASTRADCGQMVPLPEAFRILRRRQIDAAVAITALRAGEFARVAIDAGAIGLARILVDRASCLQVGERSKDPELLSISEGAKELHLRLQVAYRLCNTGIIRTVRQAGQRGRLIPAAEIRRMRQRGALATKPRRHGSTPTLGATSP